jgi:hypothetical protein
MPVFFQQAGQVVTRGGKAHAQFAAQSILLLKISTALKPTDGI